MPKGRHLKPDFFTDKNIVSMTPLARLLYQGLWCYAADCGHLDDEPLELKMRILPADNCDVDALLDEIVWHGRIERKDGVITVPKLGDHSRVDKRYETACENCKTLRDHDVKGGSKPPAHDVTTTGPRSDHDVTTMGSPRDHDADGDGDGDGDVMVKSATAGKRPTKTATGRPEQFRPSDKHQALATSLGIDLRREWPQFCDHHDARGTKFKDWSAALNTWIRNAAKFAGNVHPIRSEPDAQGRLALPPLPKSFFDQ